MDTEHWVVVVVVVLGHDVVSPLYEGLGVLKPLWLEFLDTDREYALGNILQSKVPTEYSGDPRTCLLSIPWAPLVRAKDQSRTRYPSSQGFCSASTGTRASVLIPAMLLPGILPYYQEHGPAPVSPCFILSTTYSVQGVLYELLHCYF